MTTYKELKESATHKAGKDLDYSKLKVGDKVVDDDGNQVGKEDYITLNGKFARKKFGDVEIVRKDVVTKKEVTMTLDKQELQALLKFI